MAPPSQVQPSTQAHQRLGPKPSVELKDEQIRVLKVTVVGDSCTGKTALLRSYTQKDFNIEYEETVWLKAPNYHASHMKRCFLLLCRLEMTFSLAQLNTRVKSIA